MKKPTRLWQWVGWRVAAIAAGATLLIASMMWLRYYWWDIETQSKIPPAAMVRIGALINSPNGHEAELWAYLARYYTIDDILPGLSGSDWGLVAGLLLAAIPIIFVVGFMLLRPLSLRFVEVAQAARKVADGELGVHLEMAADMPQEVQQLACDFNRMTQRLRLYEQEVQESSAMVAHELRTPLNAAMGRVRGMLDEVFPASPEQLGLVMRQLENLNMLVGDLHLLSLAQAGRLALVKSTFDLTGLLGERISWFQPQLDAAGREVLLDSPQVAAVCADRNRIGQVVNVLLDNYLRYAASEGDLCIAVTAGAGSVTLEFSDRGPGLTEQQTQRVFQRFWRKEPSRARQAGGSGLGLAIAQAICAAHQGSINVKQREGGGLVVAIMLPA